MQDIIDDIKTVYLQDNKPFIIGYSGGKDSTLLLELCIRALEQIKEKESISKVTYVISSDTMVENPTVKNCIESFNKFSTTKKAKDLKVEFIHVKPDVMDTFWVSVIGRGYPLPLNRFRWCTRNLKIIPMNKATEQINKNNPDGIINLMGIRESESQSRLKKMKENQIGKSNLYRNVENKNSIIFAPIAKVKILELWKYLVSIKETSWNVDTTALYEAYSDSSGTCPVASEASEDEMMEKCGNSRWGCWVCPLSNKIWIDHVSSPDLKKLAEFRKEFMCERDLPENRNFISYRFSTEKQEFKKQKPRLRKLNVIEGTNEVIIPAKGGRPQMIFNIKDAMNIKGVEDIEDNTMNYEDVFCMDGEFYIKSPSSYTYGYRVDLFNRLLEIKNKHKYIDVISDEEVAKCRELLDKFKGVSGNE